MTRLHLVGVNHGYQSYSIPVGGGIRECDPYVAARPQFASYVGEMIRHHRVEAAFEEAGSGYAVCRRIENGVCSGTVLQQECKREGVPHEFVDMTEEELHAQRLTIAPDDELSEEERSRRHSAREDAIAAKVGKSAAGRETCLVEVGADHLEGLRQRFERAGFHVDVHNTTVLPWAKPGRTELYPL